jgi:hypothetical protein
MGISIEQYRVRVGCFCSISKKLGCQTNICENMHPLNCKVTNPWQFFTTSDTDRHEGFVCKHCSTKNVTGDWDYSLCFLVLYMYMTAGITENRSSASTINVRSRKRIPKQKQPIIICPPSAQMKIKTPATSHIVFAEDPHLFEIETTETQMQSDCSYFSSLWTLQLYLYWSSKPSDSHSSVDSLHISE